MKRKIITIDEDACNGCEECIPNCPEGAIQIIDGKARLISDLFCDGLGACLGHCPEGAITIEEREAESYDERKVMDNVVIGGPNVIKAHLQHLQEHHQQEYLQEALQYLKDHHIEVTTDFTQEDASEHSQGEHSQCGCPGAKMLDFSQAGEQDEDDSQGNRPSQLRQWPIQMHLISPAAPYFKEADLLLAADCVAFAVGDFHRDFLKDKRLAIACPKLDHGPEIYIEKLRALIDEAKINSLTVMVMQVPCCSGLVQMAEQAMEKANRKLPIKVVVVGLKGNIL